VRELAFDLPVGLGLDGLVDHLAALLDAAAAETRTRRDLH
jgi:hypothetical protein